MAQGRKDVVTSERITRERTKTNGDHGDEERQGVADGAKDDLTEGPEWAVCQASGKEEGRE